VFGGLARTQDEADRGFLPRLPVVLLTGWGQQAAMEPDAQELVRTVLGKPVTLEDLLRELGIASEVKTAMRANRINPSSLTGPDICDLACSCACVEGMARRVGTNQRYLTSLMTELKVLPVVHTILKLNRKYGLNYGMDEVRKMAAECTSLSQLTGRVGVSPHKLTNYLAFTGMTREVYTLLRQRQMEVLKSGMGGPGRGDEVKRSGRRPRRVRIEKSEKRRAALIEIAETSLTYEEMALKLRVSKQRIEQLLRKMNLTDQIKTVLVNNRRFARIEAAQKHRDESAVRAPKSPEAKQRRNR
jgi:sulfur carrier protein ThiS